nr:Chain 3, Unindentified Stromal Protein (USP) [Chlamydomonas reinhardtii]6KAC_4 Chain 4, Unindentified Stromal Protein (USP) [Chlamydomonas reinhardtii]
AWAAAAGAAGAGYGVYRYEAAYGAA